MEIPSLRSLSMTALSVFTFRKMKKHLTDLKPVPNYHDKLLIWEHVIQLGDNMDEVRAILNVIFRKMEVPHFLTVEITTIVRRIFAETVEWLKRNFDAFPDACFTFPRLPQDGTDVFDFLIFKADGTIDHFVTAEKFVKNDGNSSYRRFLMATSHCFRDNIYSLWSNLSESEKADINIKRLNDPLLSHWFSCLTNNNYDPSLNSRDKFFSMAYQAYNTNLTALNYIYENLEPENQTRVLNHIVNVAETVGMSPAILDFEPFKKNLKDIRSRIMRINIQTTTECYLDWPHQERFLEETTGIMDHLTPSEFIYVLNIIVFRKITGKWDDYDYKELIYKLFARCLEPAKREMLEKDNFNEDDVRDYINKKIDHMNDVLITEEKKSTLESTIEFWKHVFNQYLLHAVFVLVVVVIYLF